MSKYTTEVRFICEEAAGLEESVGLNGVQEVLDNSYNKIFDVARIPMYKDETEEHRANLYKKILGHYYTREIGYETAGLWKFKLNQKMIEIMPYYNRMYESAEIQFNPMLDVDYTREYAGNRTESREISGEADRNTDTTLRHERQYEQGNDTSSNAVNNAGDNWTLFSDTPEGGITGIENAGSGNSVGNNAYLTNATHVMNTPEEQTVTTTHGTITETYNPNGDKADNVNEHAETASTEATEGEDAHTESVKGKMSGASYSKLLEEYRKTILNIDMLVIDALGDLFLNLW